MSNNTTLKWYFNHTSALFWSCRPTFTSRKISDTSLGSAFRNLYSIFFFYSFFLSLEVLGMWSGRLDASSFASEWLYPHSQPLVQTRLSRQEHPVKVTLGWVAAVELPPPLFTSGLYIPGARWNTVGRFMWVSNFWRISDTLWSFCNQSGAEECWRNVSVLILS